MTKKPEKVYLVHAELHRLSDIYGDQIIEQHDLERTGVSEEQVISRLRQMLGWHDSEWKCESVAFKWKFKLTVKIPDSDPGDSTYK